MGWAAIEGKRQKSEHKNDEYVTDILVIFLFGGDKSDVKNGHPLIAQLHPTNLSLFFR